MGRELGYKLTNEQNVSKPVADIRHAPAKPKPKPAATYSAKDRKANATNKAKLEKEYEKCLSSIEETEAEKIKTLSELKELQKIETSTVNAVIDQCISGDKTDIVKLLAKSQAKPELHALRDKAVKLEAAIMILQQKVRETKMDVKRCEVKEKDYELIDSAADIKKSEAKLVKCLDDSQESTKGFLAAIERFKALSPGSEFGADAHRLGVPAWVQNFINSHQHKLQSSDFLDVATLMQRVPIPGNPLLRPTGQSRTHNLATTDSYYGSATIKDA